MFDDFGLITLVAVTLFAAGVTGALGYGFSSITVPIALLFLTNKVLNPALVLVAIVLNSYVLLINRKSVTRVWKRVPPIILGLIPGIIAGSYILSSLNSEWLKLSTYAVLLVDMYLLHLYFIKTRKTEVRVLPQALKSVLLRRR